jgi:type II secretory pathway pseudopilin PulG
MRAQAAFEYMVIVAIVLAFILPIWAYVSSLEQQTTTQLSLSYAKNAAEKLADTANLVFSQGTPARVEVRVYIPRGVEAVTIVNKTIDFKVQTDGVLSDVTATSSASLNGTLPTREGTYLFAVEAKNGFVQITEVQ